MTTPAENDRDDLEQLASEYMESLRRGDAPDVETYAAAHPALAAEIRDLFPTIAMAEGVKAVRRSVHGPASWSNALGSRHAGAPPPASHTPATRAIDVGAPTPIPPPPGTARSGTTLGKYVLQERLGEGSLGTVWRSAHPELGVPLAIKVPRPELVSRSPVQIQRFLREANTAAQLNHPHIVRIFDAGYDQGIYFLAMEYVDGGSLGDLLRQAGGKLAVPRATAIVAAMAAALQAAAELGIVHRDIKPDNILLDRKGTPKLADLGLAKRLGGDAALPELTGTGLGVGTPLYVAPEQALGEGTPDARADIYSLGATYYQLVTGTPPFTGATAYQVVQRHSTMPVTDPRELNPEVSPAVSAVILKMLAKRPADRYQNATELAADLAHLQAGSTPAAAASGASRSPQRRRVLWLAAVVVIALGLNVLLFIAHQRQSSPAVTATVPAPVEAIVQTPPSPAPSRELAEPAAGRPVPRPDRPAPVGNVPVSADWQGLERLPQAGGAQPRPLAAENLEFKEGVLHAANPLGAQPAVLLNNRTIPDGPVTLTLEARGLVECGFYETDTGRDGCRLFLHDPSTPLPRPDGPWQRICLTRSDDGLSCTIDDEPLPQNRLRRAQATRGHFYSWRPPGNQCELRSFAVSHDSEPAAAPTTVRPSPRRSPPPPPPRTGGNALPPPPRP